MEFLSKKEIFDGSIIGIAPIRASSEELLARLERKEWYLPLIEKMGEHRRREWLSIRVVLKELLGEEVKISYYPSGKPYLSDSSYSIGISHTKGYVALILNKHSEVSIDIEHISPRVKNIRSRFMSEEEENRLSNENELVSLLLHWSAKETLFKLLGEEAVEFQTQLHIHPFIPVMNEWSCFTAHETRTPQSKSFTIHYFVHEDYVLTYV